MIFLKLKVGTLKNIVYAWRVIYLINSEIRNYVDKSILIYLIKKK